MARPKKSKADRAEGPARGLEKDQLQGPPTPYVCPECGGALWELVEGKLISYRCHVGHGYSADGLVMRHAEKLDAALWTALRTLEENAALRRHMAENMRDRGLPHISDRYLDQAAQLESRAEVIRDVVSQAEPASPPADDGPLPKKGAKAKSNGNGQRAKSRR